MHAAPKCRVSTMPMKEESVHPGKCYRTKGGETNSEKYTVISITRGIVTYQSWTTDPNRMSLRTNAGLKAFAEVLFKEIPCPNRDPGKKIEYFDPS
jgi:hypothetical protein